MYNYGIMSNVGPWDSGMMGLVGLCGGNGVDCYLDPVRKDVGNMAEEYDLSSEQWITDLDEIEDVLDDNDTDVLAAGQIVALIVYQSKQREDWWENELMYAIVEFG